MQVARQGIRALTLMLIEVSLGNLFFLPIHLLAHQSFHVAHWGDNVAHCEKNRQAHMRDIHIACVVDVCTLACIAAIG